MSQPTLLEIYESFDNGQKRQFADMVLDYGPADFADDTMQEIADDVLTEREALAMLRTFTIINHS